MPATDLADLIQQLTDQMHSAAAELQFERATRRDEITELKESYRACTKQASPERLPSWRPRTCVSWVPQAERGSSAG